MDPISIIVYIAILLFSVIFHEIAHGIVADKLGDPTAKFSGRLTLNPVNHIDPIGTILLPITLVIMNSPVVFGWAKPVPINFMGLRNPKRDIIWVGAAGPIANVLLAFILGAVFRLLPFLHTPVLANVMFAGVLVNLVLAAFNLIPIPPLDGSRILFGLLPPQAAMSYMRIEPYGFIILFVMVWLRLTDWFVYSLVALLARIIGV